MTAAFGVIMAGGSGTRFWPLSRPGRPKQLLPLAGGEESLLAATARRLTGLLPPTRVLVVTSAALAEQTRAALPQVPPENILAEPVGRNTAPCVGWAASHVARRDPDGVMAVLPADHYIGDEEEYQRVLQRALDAAQGGELVTVGVRPTRPETGYGYIELGDETEPGVYRARRFVEKPNAQRAAQFLASSNFLWNSGMFFFRASTMLQAIRTHLPGLAELLTRYEQAAAEGNEAQIVAETYADMPSVSIDHGVMEKVDAVSVIPADFGWSDLGSWTTAWELAPHDERDNALQGQVIAIDADRCYVRAPEGKTVAVIGLQDMVVVDTEDALLVMPKERAQEVRAVVDALTRPDKTPAR